MDIYVLDENKNAFTVVDDYISFIWTERYDKCGDFELYIPADINALQYLKRDNYLRIPNSDTVMIIEDIYIDTDAEEGNFITVQGRSLESILDRRIVWGQKVVSGKLQDVIHSLLDDNVINPSVLDRRIEGFIFEETNDPSITNLEFEAQFEGDNLYDVIRTICSTFNIGFKITLNNVNNFSFKLYSGKNRTYDQTENAYVVFSPAYDNLISSNYIESYKGYKNVTLVAGEGEGADRKTTTVGSGKGLDRRELFTDAKKVSSKTNDGSTVDYDSLLAQAGINNLTKNGKVVSFEANVDPTGLFKYGEHYFVGDIVQIVNEYGIQGTSRITEFIRSQNANGFTAYPTFTMIE